jgi:hypothetical protein
MSYLKQNEYKLAEEELSRGLLSYGHSSYVPDSLLALAEVSAALKKTSKVTYYREKLLGHFPNSPQARSVASAIAAAGAEKAAPMETSDAPSVVTPEKPTVTAPTVEGTTE